MPKKSVWLRRDVLVQCSNFRNKEQGSTENADGKRKNLKQLVVDVGPNILLRISERDQVAITS
jgi:hypothetical protein